LRIEYSDLALDMMRDRNIQPAEVEYVLSSYAESYPNKVGNRVIFKGYPEDRFIKVKIVAGKSPILVTTVSDSE